MNWKRLITTWVILFAGLYLVTQFFFKNKEEKPDAVTGISIETNQDSYTIDQEVIVKIQNGEKPIAYAFTCPKNPFRIVDISVSPPKEVTAETKTPCPEIEQKIEVAPGEKATYSLQHWNHAFFGKIGKFRIEIPFTVDGKDILNVATPEFTIEDRGFIKKFGFYAFYRPIYNGLVFLADFFPGKFLGIGIIVLTLLIRLILLVPSQHAMRSQKRMQEVQPKLDHIKKKHVGNQELIAKETMEIWKKEKVNPFGSCLPLLVQFPILIALFYAIRTGLSPDSEYLLYDFLKHLDFLKINPHFLWLDLTKVNTIVLPLIVGLLQFVQMKLAMAKKPAAAQPSTGGEMQMANKMMVYVLPVMIALFTASVPGGVGLYWGVSTAFGIGQQVFVNREKPANPL